MKKILVVFLLTAFLGVNLYSCKTREEKGLTKEQRERIDRDKKEFEKKLKDDED